MAHMQAEEWGELPLDLAEARERLPQVMTYMGFLHLDEESWQRRKDRCGSGWWSLPDACPATLRWSLTEVEAADSERDTSHLTRYSICYEVAMPGQILANTDAKALELEIDRILHLMIGGFDRPTQKERSRLVRLTLLANMFLSILPAMCMGSVFLGGMRILHPTTPLDYVLLAGGGVSAWGLGLYVASKGVVWGLNRLVETRLEYRAAGIGVEGNTPRRAHREEERSHLGQQKGPAETGPHVPL